MMKFLCFLCLLLCGCASLTAMGLDTPEGAKQAIDIVSELLPAPWGALLSWGGGAVVTVVAGRSVHQSEKGKLFGGLNIRRQVTTGAA